MKFHSLNDVLTGAGRSSPIAGVSIAVVASVLPGALVAG